MMLLDSDMGEEGTWLPYFSFLGNDQHGVSMCSFTATLELLQKSGKMSNNFRRFIIESFSSAKVKPFLFKKYFLEVSVSVKLA